jgi:chloramphenicol 3-O phosphotransferase
VLNGVPRSGKSSIAAAMQHQLDGCWMNLGVDLVQAATPARYQPSIGLRPGGERPDLEALIPTLYAALYESVIAHSRLGLDVVVDVGHHDAYSRPLRVLEDVAHRLADQPAYFVGVRCPLDVVLQRRDATGYLASEPDGDVPDPVRRWQREVHVPGVYDLEVDTSQLTPTECADAIQLRMDEGPSHAFQHLSRTTGLHR